MPTPSDNASDLAAASALAEEEPIAHATCPPEVIRQTTTAYSVASEERPVDGQQQQQQHAVAEEFAATEHDTQGSGDDAAPFVIEPVADSSPKTKNRDEDAFMTTLSPERVPLETKEDQSSSPTGSATSSVVSSTSASSSFNYDFSHVRVRRVHSIRQLVNYCLY